LTRMKSTICIRSRLAFGGADLAGHDPFLPVVPQSPWPNEGIYLAELQHLAGFLPVFHWGWKKDDHGTAVAKWSSR